MTWGQQNTEEEGHEQMDYVFEEINSIPLSYIQYLLAETQGRTEEIIGTWFAKTGNRDKIILAPALAGAI